MGYPAKALFSTQLVAITWLIIWGLTIPVIVMYPQFPGRQYSSPLQKYILSLARSLNYGRQKLFIPIT